ncbi:MAG TPA: DUF2877 domain-containing protein [Nocardioides sp.]|uniref:oxamate carbamoyltransferase subunit AllH family protein n=1 Tax=Nocardioides sp. TaxID=35761 RepID=UPI002D7ED5D0|nr:DUF2877 domain-containing protein [Nocardioides sp.]HET6652667.1 DUF2877 domain-containing protein [Nocardioides sp.]
MPPELACAASTLTATALPLAPEWVEAVRTPVSVHYASGDIAAPVVCVATADAVRLPHSVVVAELPTGSFTPRVNRWWTPPRPSGLTAPDPGCWARFAGSEYDDVDAAALLGRGAGLTPDGDDVLAGALVAGHATGHPALPRWRRDTVRALSTRRTTAVSVGMLHSALDGWAAPQLADAVEALCADCAAETVAADAAVAALLAVGHSSGRHLLDGVLHVLNTHPSRQQGAA